jgi:hypothetical protein
MTAAAAVEANYRHADLAVHIGPGNFRQNSTRCDGPGCPLQKYTTSLLGHENSSA